LRPKLNEARAKHEEMRQTAQRGEYQSAILRRKVTFDELLDAYIEKIKDQKFYQTNIKCFPS